MILYLRNKGNDIVDVEYWLESIEDSTSEKTLRIRPRTNVENYSKLLCSLHATDRAEFITLISNVSKLGDWLWDEYEQGRLKTEKDHEDQYEDILLYLRNKLRNISETYGLEYVED